MLDLSPLSLIEPPFSLSPDPRYFYVSLQHKATLAKVTYATEQRQGLSVVYGDVGVGKTTIARRLYQVYRDRSDFYTAYIPTPLFPSDFQFLKSICAEFNLSPKRSKLLQLAAFEEFLIEGFKEGKSVLLIIDEAQGLVGQQFELIRQLLNFETNTQKLLQIILIGQNELRNKLRLKRALASRVATKSSLEPLHFEDTRSMINFRVMVAGRQEPLFTEEALIRIYNYSRGMPRDICVIGLNILPIALLNKVAIVNEDLVDQVVEELQ
jgi:general secretion pathway protein A